jgi:hypothetical protein
METDTETILSKEGTCTEEAVSFKKLSETGAKYLPKYLPGKLASAKYTSKEQTQDFNNDHLKKPIITADSDQSSDIWWFGNITPEERLKMNKCVDTNCADDSTVQCNSPEVIHGRHKTLHSSRAAKKQTAPPIAHVITVNFQSQIHSPHGGVNKVKPTRGTVLRQNPAAVSNGNSQSRSAKPSGRASNVKPIRRPVLKQNPPPAWNGNSQSRIGMPSGRASNVKSIREPVLRQNPPPAWNGNCQTRITMPSGGASNVKSIRGSFLRQNPPPAWNGNYQSRISMPSGRASNVNSTRPAWR